MKTIHFATTNHEKISEVQRIVSYFNKNLQVISAHYNGDEPQENGQTFSENSEIKFLFYEKHLKKSTDNILITEDSGFEILELDNFPSIYSARFLKRFPTKQEAFNELAKMLIAKTGDSTSQARFVCDFCIRINGEIKHCHGASEGTISFNMKNEDTGFGYDPIFIPNNSEKTFAQMSGTQKDIFSHRTKALKQLLTFIAC